MDALYIFYSINKWNTITELFKYSGYSFTCLHNNLGFFMLHGLIKKRVSGRKKIITYTEKGLGVYSLINEILKLIQDE